MKKTIMTLTIALMAVAAQAKDIKTVVFTTNPKMHCENCEKKIKGNLRYEKGVKSIDTSVSEQTVTVKYDADKTSAETLQQAFGKFGFKAEQVGKAGHTECDDAQHCGKAQACGKQQGCCKMQAQNSEKKASCCKMQAQNGEKKAGCCKMQAQNGEKKADCCKAQNGDKNAKCAKKDGCKKHKKSSKK